MAQHPNNQTDIVTYKLNKKEGPGELTWKLLGCAASDLVLGSHEVRTSWADTRAETETEARCVQQTMRLEARIVCLFVDFKIEIWFCITKNTRLEWRDAISKYNSAVMGQHPNLTPP